MGVLAGYYGERLKFQLIGVSGVQLLSLSSVSITDLTPVCILCKNVKSCVQMDLFELKGMGCRALL